MSSGSGVQYGPARSWKDLFKEAAKLAPRVGTVQVEPQSELFCGIQMLVDSFEIVRVDVCRGSERFRVPAAGVDLAPLTYRLTVILNRDSGLVETLGDPDKWQDLPKTKQIRRAKPARIGMTIFGKEKQTGLVEPELGKNLGEGDRYVDTEGEKKPSASNIMMPDVSMEAGLPVGGENQESNKRDPPSLEPDVEWEL
jgi:hypothetical protein